jgi:hypothetical protein
MARFVQTFPPLPDRYAGDYVLRGTLDRLLGDAGLQAAVPLLETLAAEAAGPLSAAAANAEAHPPVLRMAAAAAGVRHGLMLARNHAPGRSAFGIRLVQQPLHRETLAELAVDAEAAFALTALAFSLLGQVEVAADPEAASLLRIVAALGKALTAKLAVTGRQRVRRVLRRQRLHRGHRAAPLAARRLGAADLGRHHQHPEPLAARPRRPAGRGPDRIPQPGRHRSRRRGAGQRGLARSGAGHRGFVHLVDGVPL